jgi:hypothetical protein
MKSLIGKSNDLIWDYINLFRLLTTKILENYFNLTVNLMEDRLCPAVIINAYSFVRIL